MLSNITQSHTRCQLWLMALYATAYSVWRGVLMQISQPRPSFLCVYSLKIRMAECKYMSSNWQLPTRALTVRLKSKIQYPSLILLFLAVHGVYQCLLYWIFLPWGDTLWNQYPMSKYNSVGANITKDPLRPDCCKGQRIAVAPWSSFKHSWRRRKGAKSNLCSSGCVLHPISRWPTHSVTLNNPHWNLLYSPEIFHQCPPY